MADVPSCSELPYEEKIMRTSNIIAHLGSLHTKTQQKIEGNTTHNSQSWGQINLTILLNIHQIQLEEKNIYI